MADINIVVQLQADKAVQNSDKLKRSLSRTEKEVSKLQLTLKSTTSAFKVFAGNLAAIGVARLTQGVINLTESIAQLGLESIKAASDSEETLNKFSVVFQDVATQAEETAQTLARSYGLATSESKELLSATGDLLTGFGFAGKEALELSNQVQTLAVDLASFTNFSGGAKGASDAITKALLGEREAIKSLGVSVQEADVQRQVAINTTKGLTFETERQAKAQATLDIILRQSRNAIGDFERSQFSFANQTRILNARLRDLREEMGAQLLPIATKIASEFNKFLAVLDTQKLIDFTQRGIQFARIAMIQLVESVNPVINALRFLGNSVVLVKNIFEIGFGSIIGLATELQSAILDTFSSIVNNIPEALIPESFSESFKALRANVDNASQGISSFSEGVKGDVLTDIEELQIALDGLSGSFQNVIPEETIESIKASIKSIVTTTASATTEATQLIKKSKEQLLKEQKDADKRRQEEEKKVFVQRIDATGDFLNASAALAKKGSAEAKALAIAGAIANTYAAANQVLANQLILDPITKNIQAAAIIVQGLANVSRIRSAGNFQDGGIIPGSSFSGDNVTANVNSGEMILNRGQQAELFALANGGGGGGQVIQNNIVLELDGEVVTRSVSRSVANGTVLGEEGV